MYIENPGVLLKKEVYLLVFFNTLWFFEYVFKLLSITSFVLFLAGTKTWRGIVKGFVPVGICLLAVMQWRAYRKYSHEKIAPNWQINLYCSLPLRGFSRCWGWIAGNITNYLNFTRAGH